MAYFMTKCLDDDIKKTLNPILNKLGLGSMNSFYPSVQPITTSIEMSNKIKSFGAASSHVNIYFLTELLSLNWVYYVRFITITPGKFIFAMDGFSIWIINMFTSH